MDQLSNLIQLNLPELIKYEKNTVITKIYAPKLNSSFVCLQQDFAKFKDTINKQLNHVGVLIFRGFDIKSPNQFASILNTLGKKPFKYNDPTRQLIVGTQTKDNRIQVFAHKNQPQTVQNKLIQNKDCPDHLALYCFYEPDKGGDLSVYDPSQLQRYVAEKYSGSVPQLQNSDQIKAFCSENREAIQDQNQTIGLKFSNGDAVPLDIITNTINYVNQIKVSIPWKRGDLVLIDNRRIAQVRESLVGRRIIYQSLLQDQQTLNTQQLSLILNSGDRMPLIGFGTWKISQETCAANVYKALKCGYKLLDCASCYANQEQVGEAIVKAIDDKIITRKDIFVTSKLWNTYHRPQNVRQACERTLKDLKLQYLDLYLIHFPLSLKFVPFEERYPPGFVYNPTELVPKIQQDFTPIIDTWRAMEQLVREGLVRNIGVSNFNISLLRDLNNQAKIKPSVLQVELHPFLTQKMLVRFCREAGIQVTSYSTFGGSSYIELSQAKEEQTLDNCQLIKSIASEVGKTPYQVVLRWAIQSGLAVIPKSSREEKILQNAAITDFILTSAQIAAIDGLNRNKRYNDPGQFAEKDFKTFFPIFE